MGRLQGLRAVVTGSTSGIGKAIAQMFAAEGASVAVHGIEDSDGLAVVEAIRAAGGKAQYLHADLAVPTECERLIAQAVDALGGLDVLVNNAAVVPRGGLEQADAAAFDAVMAVNARAPLLLVRAALRAFQESGGGVVLNIGSVNACCGEAGLLVYSMSKGALMTMTRNLSDALGPEGVRVNQLNLGWVLTEREQIDQERAGNPPDWPSHVSRKFAPSGKLFSPEEIARYAVAFVEPGGFVSGSVVDIHQYPILGRNPPKTP